MREVSCVIPTHGRPDLLTESLQAVANQTGVTGLQVIVVDDMSQKATEHVVTSFAARYPQIEFVYAARPAGGGASASRNFGADRSDSELLAFLDDDDMWEPEYLSAARKALEESGAAMAVAWMKRITRGGEVLPHYSIASELAETDVIARNPGITGSNFVIRRKSFDLIHGFDSNLPVSNDKDFFARFLAESLPYVVIEKRFVFHRQHSDDQLTSWDERRAAGLVSYLHKYRTKATLRDRRYLRRQIHSIRFRTAGSPLMKLGHVVGLAVNSDPRDLARKVVQKVGSRR
ncbi:glycosyltransferase family 2 protein [Herbiconiux liukaitaii]|uniref:glycosyltransferase family 2 protein n=1 Tax=Herbiconiux liukaitaii TaxID=3342799 RepID=UPI0035B9C040